MVKLLVMAGTPAATTVKLDAVEAFPLPLATVIGPVCAPLGTVTVICVLVKLPAADTFPAKVTENGGVKFVPFNVTISPTAPLGGLKLVIVGASAAFADRQVVATATRVRMLACSQAGKERAASRMGRVF